MVTEVNHPDELGGMDTVRQLPLVLQFIDGSEIIRYIIENPDNFYEDPDYPATFSASTRDNWSKLQRLCQNHGRVIGTEEYDAGIVCLSSSSKDQNYEIKEFRYQSAT